MLNRALEGKIKLDKDADIEKYSKAWGLENISVYDDKKFYSRFLVADYQDSVILTFRHTDSNGNWLTNADIGLWQFDHPFTFGEKIHHGFGRMLGSMWDPLVAELKKRTSTGKKVWIYGHSLGAALATLSAPKFVELGIPIEQVVVKGSPKVASSGWVKKAKQALRDTPIYRVSNSSDLIARLPVHKGAFFEFRESFDFLSDRFTTFIGNNANNLSYDLIGTEINIQEGNILEYWTLDESIENEKVFWREISNKFKSSDEVSNSIKSFFSGRYTVMEEQLSIHLMRKLSDGYACSLTGALVGGEGP